MRWAKLFDIPLCEGVPPGFPPLTLGVQRTLTALPPAKVRPALHALWGSFWGAAPPAQVKQITEPDVLREVLTEALGKEQTEEAIQAAQGKEVKDRLMAVTQSAIDMGAFGVPWFEGKPVKF
jgi:2-hydroxychromene-2-carboxylate isomerase